MTWEEECKKWHGRELTGLRRHYCSEWDGLPVDETCDEFSVCICDLESVVKMRTEKMNK